MVILDFYCTVLDRNRKRWIYFPYETVPTTESNKIKPKKRADNLSKVPFAESCGASVQFNTVVKFFFLLLFQSDKLSFYK